MMDGKTKETKKVFGYFRIGSYLVYAPMGVNVGGDITEIDASEYNDFNDVSIDVTGDNAEIYSSLASDITFPEGADEQTKNFMRQMQQAAEKCVQEANNNSTTRLNIVNPTATIYLSEPSITHTVSRAGPQTRGNNQPSSSSITENRNHNTRTITVTGNNTTYINNMGTMFVVPPVHQSNSNTCNVICRPSVSTANPVHKDKEEELKKTELKK